MNGAADSLGYVGKRVVVTGCRSGIGEATARLLLDAGAFVHGIDWQDGDLPLAAFTRLDLRDSEAIVEAAKSIGPVDALFSCAGLPPMAPPLDVLKVNFIGMRMLTEVLFDRMPPGSAIVSVGSVGGARWPQHLAELRELVATEDFAAALAWCETHDLARADAYGFSKEAIAVWTMTASARTIKNGVRLNCTSPG
ncbi:MAG: SDR family NAD(P)-dependent oxidoreductase, partial [Novosphingobium sp.]